MKCNAIKKQRGNSGFLVIPLLIALAMVYVANVSELTKKNEEWSEQSNAYKKLPAVSIADGVYKDGSAISSVTASFRAGKAAYDQTHLLKMYCGVANYKIIGSTIKYSDITGDENLFYPDGDPIQVDGDAIHFVNQGFTLHRVGSPKIDPAKGNEPGTNTPSVSAR